MRDTIFAPATVAGRSAVAVLRVSGPQARTVGRRLCGSLPPPRHAALRRIRDEHDATVDEALVLWMPGPGTFTGEDSLELHTHGSLAVVARVTALLTDSGARLAQPGEFTRRAFEGGRLDLAQAEAVADLVDAETEGQRRQAISQLAGALSDRYTAWRDKLFDALALLEAAIDFPEDDLPDGVTSGVWPILRDVSAEIGAEVSDYRGERVRDGVRIALIGAPNVGKSSLLNTLAGRDAAIVTPIAGTTRDLVEVILDLAGQRVVLVDTAGLRETVEIIEQEGVRRARQAAASADLRVLVVDAARPETWTLSAEGSIAVDVIVLNKIDLVAALPPDAPSGLATVASPEGIRALQAWLDEQVKRLASGRDFPAVTRARHREMLTECLDHLERAIVGGVGAELAGEDVRLAIRTLERVTGRSDPEAVLDRVFAGFCIGK